ncbi:hypothetical protein SAMN05216389_11134 [Oceanobacillus limi]|uniref:Uncharacterized protein n=1 Tax=Oceanobacillus limi TaxID=930131 RepID=A0A1I0ECC6_9BACI|nr:hypothetical protein [Oceanobacillus limi]SET42733.1 hypothetical protein SAMN05216389_11134 [Oceanobacillus limi]
MAKLQGVEVIDMVGGEVTKIAYAGAEYTKVDERAEMGDIVLSNGTIDARKGFYYEVNTEDGYGDRAIVDDVSSKRSALDKFVVFRKSSAPTLTERVGDLETRVSAIESGKQAEGFVKVDRKPKVGDYVKFTETDDDDITVGKYYEIIEIDSDGDPRFIADGGGENVAVSYETFEIYAKTSDTPTQVIEGDPQVGDKIRIVDVHILSVGDYEEGDIFTVDSVHHKTFSHRSYVKVKENDENIFREEFEIIERPKKAEKPALKVGDYAKVVEHNNDNCFGGKGGTPVGDIVKIVDVWGSSFKWYRVEELDGGDYDGNPNAKEDALTKATDEEVAEAKRKLAEQKEAEKWSALGRKPNEYKVGDIVRVTIAAFGGHEVGTIGELVEEMSITGNHRVLANGKVYSQRYELITPVEQRFDR